MTTEIRDIGTTVRQVVAGTAPALGVPELMQVIIGLNRQVVTKGKAGQYAAAAVDILLVDLLSTSDLDGTTVRSFLVNEFGEFEVPKTTDITDLASFKLNGTNTATSFPAYLRYLRTSQALHATGVLTVDSSTNIQAPIASAAVTISGNDISVATAAFGSVLAGDILELNDVNNANVLRRFRVTADVDADTVTVESKNPDGIGVLAPGTDTNIRVFRPVYTLTDTTAKFLDNRTRPFDDGQPGGSKYYPQPGDTLSNPATFKGLYAFVSYQPLVGSTAIWRMKTWTSNTAANLDLVPSGGTGPQWAGPPMFTVPSVRYLIQTQEPAVGRVPLAQADVFQSYVALRNDLVNKPTKIQGAAASLATFGPAVGENPLGLAMFEAATISPNLQVMGVAVATNDEVGHGLALDALTTEEDPYELVPLCTAPGVISIYQAHVNALSAPEERKERTVIFSLDIPVRTVKTDLGDGVSVDVTAGSPATIQISGAAFLTNGAAPGDLIELDDTINATLRRFVITFVVSEIKVQVLSLNPDALGALVDGTYDSVKVVTADYTAAQQVDLLAATATAYHDRRLTFVLPDHVFLSPNGVEIEVDGSFAASNVAALSAINDPGKPLSLAVVPGLSRISGSNSRFTHSQLKALTSAGILVLTQTSPLVSPIIRFEVTTDVSNKKVQQRSFTRIVDSLAKSLRLTLNNILGRERITDEFLNKANVAISSVLENFLRLKRISDYQVTDFGISTIDATALAVVIVVTIPNVGNNIDITLVV